MNRNARFLPFAALGVGVLAISWSAIFVRWAQMPGIASAFYRLLIASAGVWIIVLTHKAHRSAISRDMVPLAALGGIFFAGDIGCYNVAVWHTTAGGATFLGNNSPLIVGLFTWFLTGKLPARRFWAALLLGLIGGWLIFYVDHVRVPMRGYGNVLATFASVCFALYLMVTERLRKQTSTVTLVALSSTASTVALFLVAIFTGTSLRIPSGSSLASLAGLGLVCQLFGYFCLTYALGHLPATISSVILLVLSPLTAIWALFCFDERMTALQWCGGILILAAVWLVGKNSNRVEEPRVSAKSVSMNM